MTSQSTSAQFYLSVAVLAFISLLPACSEDDSSARHAKSAQVVATDTVALRNFAITEKLSGNLQPWRSARIHSQLAGTVAHIFAYPGDQVKRGALLAQLDDSLLAAQHDKALALRDQAKLDLQRAESLASNKLLAEDALARARTAYAISQADAKLAQVQFNFSRITAPFDGVMDERLIDEGDVVANQTLLMTVLDVQRFKVQVFVSEALLPQLVMHASVNLQLDSAAPAVNFSGRITRIPPGLNALTRQAEIEITIDNAPASAMPGQICRITLQGKNSSRLMTSFDALRHDTQGAFVYRVVANKVQRVTVQTGVQQDGAIEIVHGLNAQDQVVTKGFTGLQDGKAITLTSAATAPAK